MTREERKGGAVRALGDLVDARGQPQHALDPDSSRSAELLRRVLSSLPAIVYRSRLDSERTVEFMSLGCRIVTGFEAADLVANRVTSYAQLIHAGDRARVLEVVKGAAQSGQPFELSYTIRRVDGREVAVREHGYAVVGASGEVEAIEGIITAVKGATERELEKTALDVAHDLNNALATIKTTAELAQLEARDRTVIADLSEIIAAATRAGALSERLRRGPRGRSDQTRTSE
jgi:signal transduction histidine kinase